ncbi:hypothetical protein, partial [Neisseria dumasiana]
MRTNKPVEGIAYNSNREGFIFALARRESSADLNKDDTFNEYPIRVINDHGYVGLFQYGTPALIDIGYKTRDGQWTGKNGATSLEAFRSSRQTQIAAINLSIDLWCKRLRATGLNEYYGKIVKGIEITESGCIAGCHLVGLGGLASFLNVPGNLKINKSTGKNHKEFDGNGVHISHYIDLFAHYDMESCCKRKIRIGLKDPSGLPIEGKHVTILSSYEGKHTNSQFKIEHKTDADGELPVIVRHPGAKITLEIDGRKSEDITQKADQIQPFNIVASDLKISAPLAEKGKPEAKKQEAVQEKKEEQQQTPVEANKDINFNIAILEGDTKKTISNVKFTLVYKGKPKQHITDSQGIKKNIIAEAGQSVQVCVAGEGNLQPVKSFTVTESLKDTTVEVALPVHTFNIVVVDTKGKIVPNAEFSIFYRNKERTRKTDSEGRLKIKALVGFVCGFGNRGNPLTYFRCLQSVSLRKIIVNSTAVQIAKGSAGQTVVTTAVQAAKQTKEAAKPKPPLPTKTEKQQSKPQERKKDEKPQQQEPVKQKNTHTEKNGNPLTVVGNEKTANDTTRYHIYYNGTIKRENKEATGYAEFIYYDSKGKQHYFGKSKFVSAPKRGKGNSLIGGTVYLLDQREHGKYVNWEIQSESSRFYLNGVTMAAVLGALKAYGNEKFIGTGFSTRDGRSVGGSTSHINGQAGDFRYLGKKQAHLDGAVLTFNSSFDMEANKKLVELFRLFGFKYFLTGTKANGGVAKIPGTSYYRGHHNHLHIGNHSYVVTD